MTTERKEILDKVNTLINKRKNELLDLLPNIHKVDDGIIIRFFGEWDNCDNNESIKYKKIPNLDDPDEIVVFFYLPKGAYFDLRNRDYICHMTCLNGKIEIEYNNETRILNAYNKIFLNTKIFEGHALENSYVVTTNRQYYNYQLSA
jgi:hypothetical protein